MKIKHLSKESKIFEGGRFSRNTLWFYFLFLLPECITDTFYASATEGGAGGIMFSGCPSVRPSVRTSVRPYVPFDRYHNISRTI